jgi:hypothetical protein
MTGAYLLRMWRQAVQSGKDAVLVVSYGNGIRATVHITRDADRGNQT